MLVKFSGMRIFFTDLEFNVSHIAATQKLEFRIQNSEVRRRTPATRVEDFPVA